MRDLTFEEVRDTVVGASVLGCGGGGELAEGLELVERARDEGLSFRLAGLDELPDDAILACAYAVGAMTMDADDERYIGLPLAERHPTVLAVETLCEHTGSRLAGMIPGELGATSVAEAFYPAAAFGLPVIDADPAGRAVPEMQHSTFFLEGLPIAPQAVVNEFGETLLLLKVLDDRRSEALVRALAIASRNAVWVADHALPAGRLRTATIPGTVSLALRVGQALRAAHERGEDLGDAVAVAGGGRVLFTGVIAKASWKDADGFTYGEFTVAGEHAHTGHDLRVWFKNENLMAWRDKRPVVTVPDLICVIDEETHVPVTNPNAREGMRVTVLAIPAPQQWLEPVALDVFSPRTFGFDLDYRPFSAWSADG